MQLPMEKKDYNKKISQRRILIENHFSYLKDWGSLSVVYKGDIRNHMLLFCCCELFLCWSL